MFRKRAHRLKLRILVSQRCVALCVKIDHSGIANSARGECE